VIDYIEQELLIGLSFIHFELWTLSMITYFKPANVRIQVALTWMYCGDFIVVMLRIYAKTLIAKFINY